MEFWDKITKFFQALWLDTWNTLASSIDRVGSAFMTWWKEGPGKAMREDMELQLNKLQEDYKLEEETIAPMRKAIDKPFPLDVLVLMWYNFSLHLFGLMALWVARRKRVELEVNELERLSILDIGTLVAVGYKHPSLKADIDKLLATSGYSDKQIDMAFMAAQQRPTVDMVLTLLNRGTISENQAANILTEGGLDDDDAARVLSLRFAWPTPSELPSLAGREAFEESQIDAFDLDRDMPEKYIQAAAKAGLTREVARWYWVAHWRNPSINQMFEMIQRKARKPNGQPFTMADLDSFLKLDDINPFFGQGLLDIAYNPLTRVDIRRMYQIGVLKEEDLPKHYEAAGYSPENAKHLQEFTVRVAKYKERDLTKAQIDALYLDHFIDAAEYRRMVRHLGYDEQESYYLLDLLDFRMRKAEVDAQTKETRRKFFRSLITETQARGELDSVGIKGAQADRLLRIWEDQRPGEATLPTKADVVGWFQGGQIDAEEFNTYFRELGYRPADIEHYRQGLSYSPSLTTVIDWFHSETIDEGQTLAYLKQLGIPDKEAQLYLLRGREIIARRKEFTNAKG